MSDDPTVRKDGHLYGCAYPAGFCNCGFPHEHAQDEVKAEAIKLAAENLKRSNAVIESMHDAVNHPTHYTSHPSGVECIEVTEHFNFNIGNAVKYLWRAGLKGNAAEDLSKARWYIEREIIRLERREEDE